MHKIKQISTQVFFSELLNAEKLNVTQLNQILLSEFNTLGFNDLSGYSLYKNVKGAVIRDERIIDTLNSLYPSHARILSHPIWNILEHHKFRLPKVHQAMKSLPSAWQRRLFQRDKNNEKLSRIPLSGINQLDFMGLQNDLNALACLLLLVRELELKCRPHAYIAAKWAAYKLLIRLSVFPPIHDVSEDLSDIIHERFIGRNHPFPKSFQDATFSVFPRLYKIPNQVPINLAINYQKRVLAHARKMEIISSDIKEQLDFLFWFEYQRLDSVTIKAILAPSSDARDDVLQPRFLSAARALRGDSRLYIRREEFFN